MSECEYTCELDHQHEYFVEGWYWTSFLAGHEELAAKRDELTQQMIAEGYPKPVGTMAESIAGLIDRDTNLEWSRRYREMVNSPELHAEYAEYEVKVVLARIEKERVARRKEKARLLAAIEKQEAADDEEGEPVPYWYDVEVFDNVADALAYAS